MTAKNFLPKPYEIYLAKVRFYDCSDSRPVIILESLPDDKLAVLCLSAQMDKFTDHPDQMYLSKEDPDYAATLLPKGECFIDRTQHEISVSDLVKQFGALSGELRKRFEKWI